MRLIAWKTQVVLTRRRAPSRASRRSSPSEFFRKLLYFLSFQWLLDAVEARKDLFVFLAGAVGFAAAVHYGFQALGAWGWLGLSVRALVVGGIASLCARGVVAALPVLRVLLLVVIPLTLVCAALSWTYSVLYHLAF